MRQIAAVVLLLAAIDAYAFDTPAEEPRFRALIDELRCPKCLNTNLAGSDAPIAADLRHEVYILMREGRSDAEIKDFLQARYGDFILYRPPFNARTALVWLVPMALFVTGIVVLGAVLLRRPPEPGPLSDEDLARVDALLNADAADAGTERS